MVGMSPAVVKCLLRLHEWGPSGRLGHPYPQELFLLTGHLLPSLSGDKRSCRNAQTTIGTRPLSRIQRLASRSISSRFFGSWKAAYAAGYCSLWRSRKVSCET